MGVGGQIQDPPLRTQLSPVETIGLSVQAPGPSKKGLVAEHNWIVVFGPTEVMIVCKLVQSVEKRLQGAGKTLVIM